MLDKEQIYKDRMTICKQCPLYKEDKIRGPICDSNKYISKDGTKWSGFRKDGYVRGCSCGLKNKIRNIRSSCIVGKG